MEPASRGLSPPAASAPRPVVGRQPCRPAAFGAIRRAASNLRPGSAERCHRIERRSPSLRIRRRRRPWNRCSPIRHRPTRARQGGTRCLGCPPSTVSSSTCTGSTTHLHAHPCRIRRRRGADRHRRGSVFAGTPPRALLMAREWRRLHLEELHATWERARRENPDTTEPAPINKPISIPNVTTSRFFRATGYGWPSTTTPTAMSIWPTICGGRCSNP
jgi:hypothetical protein